MEVRGGPDAVASTTSLRRWVGLLGIGLAVAATRLLITVGPLAALGIVVVGLFGAWLLLDFTAAAIGLFVASLLVPNGVALYFGPNVPLLTLQRAMFALLVAGAFLHAPLRFTTALWTAPRTRLLLGMMLILAISTILSSQPGVSTEEFFSERALGLPFYFAAVWIALQDARAAKYVLWGIVVASLIILLLAAGEAVTGRGVVASLGVLPPAKLLSLGYREVLERRVGLPRVESVFQHPLQLGAYLVALVPLLIVLRRQALTRSGRLLCNVTLGLGLLALVFTWSRGAWLALLLALLLSSGRGGRRWLVLGAGGAAFLLVWWRLGFLTGGALGYRWWLIRGVAHSVLSHYGFGTGLGTFSQNVIVRIASTSQTAGVDPLAYSLTMAIEAGPLFVVLLWWLVGGSLREAARARAQARDAGQTDVADLLGALRAGLLANLLLSLFTTSLFGTTEGLFITFMLLAITLRLSRGDAVAGKALPPEPALAR